ncbi:MAG: tRNA (guanosine(46)-N7)-methyltransferase TrmB [Actinobacteria bacterium]|nr:tRNA (guanosine(46)-N7)-methyltransferase TrmB [Actinomycetota bacterium]
MLGSPAEPRRQQDGTVATGRDEGYGARQGARTTQRRGRMTAARHAVLAELGPAWLLDPADATSPAALTRAFGRQAPLVLDIGAGNGEATRAWAEAHPDHDVLAVELHRPGLARLVRDLHDAGPPNVRAVEADALLVLEAMPPGSLAGLRVLFPDPWPKRRHVGRRLVDPAFVRLATDRLAVGGWLHVATDWDDYAQQARASLATEARLEPVVDEVDEIDGAVADEDGHRPGWDGPPWRTQRPERPVTAYEQRGLDAGRSIADLVALRRS